MTDEKKPSPTDVDGMIDTPGAPVKLTRIELQRERCPKCRALLRTAFPHPSDPNKILSECGSCRRRWTLTAMASGQKAPPAPLDPTCLACGSPVKKIRKDWTAEPCGHSLAPEAQTHAHAGDLDNCSAEIDGRRCGFPAAAHKGGIGL